jgi:hypothetical protein
MARRLLLKNGKTKTFFLLFVDIIKIRVTGQTRHEEKGFQGKILNGGQK